MVMIKKKIHKNLNWVNIDNIPINNMIIMNTPYQETDKLEHHYFFIQNDGQIRAFQKNSKVYRNCDFSNLISLI